MKVIRIVAAYVDNMVVATLCSPLLMLYIKRPVFWTLGCFILGYTTLFLLKDIPFLSIGKKIVGLDIYQYGTDDKATIKQRICRNIILLIWPVELIALLLSSEGRRLSDRLCGTIIKRRLKA